MKLLILLLFIKATTPQPHHFPLTLQLDREWHLPTTTPIGSKVTQVKLSPESRDVKNVTYELEPSFHRDLSDYFSIDGDSGVVLLKKSLQGKKGEGSVTVVGGVEGGTVTKVEVRVVVSDPDEHHYKPKVVVPGFFPFVTTATTSSTTATPTTSSTTATPTTTANVTTNSTTQNNTSLTTTTTEEESTTTITIIAIATTSTIIILIVIAIFTIKRLKSKKKIVTKEIRKSTSSDTQSHPPTWWHGLRAESNRYEENIEKDQWEVPRHKLKIIGILGEGCFGQVWRGELDNDTVAVKTLKESAGDRERDDLLSELKVMKSLDNHPNVVRLLGCCLEGDDPPFIILEYVQHKLQTYLRESRDSHYYGNLHSDSGSLSSRDLTSFCFQVAKGMQFLSQRGIIHRDLAARNILLDGDKVTCKVADFGFARDLVGERVYERKSDGRLPVRWMAPESLFLSIFTTKSDVWSFGVLMWEIVTLGSTPYPGTSASEVMKKVQSGYRLEKPMHCRRELYNIMFYCWHGDGDNRPGFSELVKMLGALLGTQEEYIDLDCFPEHAYYDFGNREGAGDERV